MVASTPACFESAFRNRWMPATREIRFPGFRVNDGAVADDVVRHDQRAGPRKFERKLEIFEIGLLVGVNEDQVERLLAGRDEFLQALQGRSLAHLDRSQKHGASEVPPGDPGVERIDFEREEAPSWGSARPSQMAL